MTTLLSLTKKASVSLEAAAKPVNVILLEVIFDKPEIELANAKVTVSVPETVAVMLVEPAKFNTSPELIVCCVDELSFILKAVVTLVLISFIAATIDDVSVVPKLARSPTSVPRLLKVVLKPSNVLVVATLLIAILLYYFLY